MPAEEAESDAVTHLPGGDVLADFVDQTDDFVAGHDRAAGVGPLPLHAQEIAVAHPAGEYADAHVPRFGRHDVALDEFELALAGHLKGAVGRHRWLLGMV